MLKPCLLSLLSFLLSATLSTTQGKRCIWSRCYYLKALYAAPPRLEFELQDSYTFDTARVARVRPCSFTGTPTPVVTWTFNGNRLVQSWRLEWNLLGGWVGMVSHEVVCFVFQAVKLDTQACTFHPLTVVGANQSCSLVPLHFHYWLPLANLNRRNVWTP